MLRRIKIEQLYDLYTYELDFENVDNSPMKFLTGPNGYGKSTLLNMVFAVFAHDCKTLFKVPFEKFILYFEDAEVLFVQEREYEQGDKSDLKNLKRIELHVSFIPVSGDEEHGTILPDGECNMPNLEMYLAGNNAYYIDDKRVMRNTIDANAEKISDIVERLTIDAELLRERIRDNQIDFSSPVLEMGEEIFEDEYKNRVAKIVAELKPLKEWGMVNEEFIPIPYLEVVNNLLRKYLDNIEFKMHIYSEFIGQVSLFKALVDESIFANKTLRIDDEVGFLFYSQSKLKEPLLPEKLSSGERHLLLQLFELIFRAPQGALVLIDEPELSMHMYWQLRYSKMLSRIAELRKLHFIVATHSPQIFNSMWNRSIDLYKLTKKAK